MTIELLSPQEAQEQMRTLKTRYLANLDTLGGISAHVTLLYQLLPNPNGSKRSVCGTCEQEPAEFLIYDRDHFGQVSLNATCNDCSPKSYHEARLNKDF